MASGPAAGDSDAEVAAWHVHLQHAILEVALLGQSREHCLVVARHAGGGDRPSAPPPPNPPPPPPRRSHPWHNGPSLRHSVTSTLYCEISISQGAVRVRGQSRGA